MKTLFTTCFLLLTGLVSLYAQNDAVGIYLFDFPEIGFKRYDSVFISGQSYCIKHTQMDTTIELKDGSIVRLTPEDEYIYVDNAKGKGLRTKKLRDGTLLFARFEPKIVEWELLDEQQVINGFKCQKARAKNANQHKMKQDPVAWFSSSIPVVGGPSAGANAYGLPGMVVKLEFEHSTDVYYRLVNVEVKSLGNIEPATAGGIEVSLDELLLPEKINKKWLKEQKEKLAGNQ